MMRHIGSLFPHKSFLGTSVILLFGNAALQSYAAVILGLFFCPPLETSLTLCSTLSQTTPPLAF